METDFNEAWRTEKEFFYDPTLHGIDWDAMYARYHPLVTLVQRHEDLNELLVEMIGELQVGHNRVSGGDVYNEPTVAVGLLGTGGLRQTIRARKFKLCSTCAMFERSSINHLKP